MKPKIYDILDRLENCECVTREEREWFATVVRQELQSREKVKEQLTRTKHLLYLETNGKYPSQYLEGVGQLKIEEIAK